LPQSTGTLNLRLRVFQKGLLYSLSSVPQRGGTLGGTLD
jgi:hypothetical protein